MSNAAHATSEALDVIDTLAEQLNISQLPAESSPKDYCAAGGYSDELIRLFEEGKPTDEKTRAARVYPAVPSYYVKVAWSPQKLAYKQDLSVCLLKIKTRASI
jgi:hypothetical protein